MRKLWCLCVFLCFVVISFGELSAAEPEDEPGLFLIFKDKVNPSMMGDYIKQTLKCKEIYEENHFPSSVFCYRYMSDVFNVIPLKNFAEIDKAKDLFESLEKKVGEEDWKKLGDEMAATTESSEAWFCALRKDLSYILEKKNFNVDQEEEFFLVRTAYYVKPDKVKEMEGCLKEFAKLCKDRGAKIEYRVTQMIFSDNLPAYVVLSQYNNIEDFGKQVKERDELLGDAAQAIYAKGAHFIRDIEEMVGLRSMGYLNYHASKETEGDGEIAHKPSCASEIEGIWEIKEDKSMEDDFFVNN